MKKPKWHERYIELEISKFEMIKDNFHFSETIDTVKSADLYPEFKIGSDENVGYFNPFMVGELENITKIGKEASVLTMLPFYKRVITKIIPLTKDN